MTEIILSAGISVLLVLLEAMGILISRWTIAKKNTEAEMHRAVAVAATTFDPESVPDGEDPAAALLAQLAGVANLTRAKDLGRFLGSVAPGPELCFLSMTVVAILFTGFSYADDSTRTVISPLLADTRSAFPIMFGVFVLSLVAWIGLLIWREAIAMTVQRRLIRTSIVTIISLGGATLTLAIYLLIGGRV